MKKVISRIQGGLGNQLFCYCAARRLSLHNNAELVIDDVSGFTRDKQYKRVYALDKFNIKARKATPVERMEPFERYRRALSKHIARKKPFHLRRYIEQKGNDFNDNILSLKIDDSVYLDGYWQSEKYFKDNEDIIREDLKIISPNDKKNNEIVQKIKSCNSVSVHVRFFDMPDENGNNNITKNYYSNAIKYIEEHVTDPHYFLFSDFPQLASETLPISQKRTTCISHNKGDDKAYIDLQLMSHCKHFIIANSTFSWWGAWLSKNVNKYVIAPGDIMQNGKMAWGFKGLLPESWIIL